MQVSNDEILGRYVDEKGPFERELARGQVVAKSLTLNWFRASEMGSNERGDPLHPSKHRRTPDWWTISKSAVTL